MAKTTEKKKTNTKKGPAKKSAKKKTQSKTAKKTVKQPEKQTRSIPFSETERPRRRTTEEKQAEVRKTRQEDESTKKLKDTIIGLVYIALGIFVFIAVQFKTAGEVGNQLGTFLKGALGLVGLIFPWYLVVIGLLLVTHVALHFSKKTILMTLLIVLLLCLINSGRFIDPQVNVLTDTVRFYNEGTTLEGGGFLGMFFGTLIVKLLGKPGLYIFSGCGLAIALFMILNSPVSKWLEARRVKKDEDAKIAEMERVEQARIEAYERAEERERQREERERQREGRTKIEIPPPQIYLEGIGTSAKPSGSGSSSIFSAFTTQTSTEGTAVKTQQSNAFEIAKQSPTVGKTEKTKSNKKTTYGLEEKSKPKPGYGLSEEDIKPAKKSIPDEDKPAELKKKVVVDKKTQAATAGEADAGMKKKLSDYKKPPIDLLLPADDIDSSGMSAILTERAMKLENTLKSFNVDAHVVGVKQGPSITRYEIQPEVGVKVARIKNLENDIALNLKAKSIRIEAPIPGKAAVGIEVDNDKSHIVRIREVIDSNEFKNAKSKITFAVGKDIAGKPIIADLNKMPHLLIAGTTGSGKSVCMNGIITSFLYKADPDEVKLILIDPKKVEFGNYEDIPHLLIPVVQDEAKAAAALSWAVVEMTNRYKAFAELGVRNIQGYNELMNENGASDLVMPQIVIIIDELADLMIAAKKQVEESIVRLAQLARAAGMHLIVATQRPTVNVITGLIKANIPSRIAFKVPTFVDSKTIIDMAGAEKLLGNGDMLFYPLGANKPYRVQGAFIDDSEVNGLIEYVKAQGKAVYSEEASKKIEKGQNGESMEMDETADEFLKDAIEFVIEKEKASTSMLQRQFRIGYNRAANLIDEMEKRGIVGPPDGARPRQVLMTMDEYKGITKTVDLPNLDDIAYQEEYDDDSVVTKEDIFPEAVETETEPDVPAVPDAGPDTSYGDLSKRVIPMGTSQFSSILDHRDTMSFGYDYEGTSAADDFLGLRDEDE